MFAYWGFLSFLLGVGTYFFGVFASAVRLALLFPPHSSPFLDAVVWYSGVPVVLGVLLMSIDFLYLLPGKRGAKRMLERGRVEPATFTVALTAFNDKDSIVAAVRDFQSDPRVLRVIVVDNNSSDGTFDRAAEAGALVVRESLPGYGHCVYRCLQEATRFEDAGRIVICEGDLTFRAFDLDKLIAYAAHAEIVNGTRIVEQLRKRNTQLTTFMYYANLLGGKLLELKHLGKGTFTDVGTTYKLLTIEAARRLLRVLDPAVNLEFNLHLLDRALVEGITIVECPVTFHSRVGVSKGGNANNFRAMKVGLRMLVGMSFGWRWVRGSGAHRENGE